MAGQGHPMVATHDPRLVQAATTLAHHLARHGSGIDLVVNAGTAGALSDYGVGDVAAVAVVAQHDFDHEALSALAGQPLPGGPITLTGPEGASARLATGDRFITDPVEREVLAKNADLVDMEGYAVAATCRQFGVPVWIVKCVSDAADAGAALSWQEAVHMAARNLARWAEERGLLSR
jgi:adenosylhomocysteine nucleosidase